MSGVFIPPRPGGGEWSQIVACSSGGKDSQTALRQLVRAAEADGFPLDRITVSHQDLGRMEWAGSRELAQRQAEHYGLRFEVSRYRDNQGKELSLLEGVRRRGKWPDNKNRYCTSDWKRGPGNRVITALRRERPGHILQVFGFRAAESAARAKKPVLKRNPRAGNRTYDVYDWLPIHHWSTEEVWRDIRESGVPYHRAYDLGMSRLSCVFCIFAPRAALIIAGRANPGLLDEYCAVEIETGHRFTMALSLCEVREAIRQGEQPGDQTDVWNM